MSVSKFEQELLTSTPHVIIVKGDNLLDPNTPRDTPLSVCGWGMGSKYITYNLPGWDEIKEENDEYFILSDCNRCYVMRVSIEHEKFVSESTIRTFASWYSNENCEYCDDYDCDGYDCQI